MACMGLKEDVKYMAVCEGCVACMGLRKMSSIWLCV